MNVKVDPRRLVLGLLQRSKCGTKVACCAFDRHGIFAWAWNFGGSSNSRGTHAEEHCVSKRSNKARLHGATMVVAGMRKNGNFVYSRPCEKICLPLLKKHGVAKIIFTAKDGSWVTQKLNYV